MSAPSRALVAFALLCLCVQNSALMLSMRYSRAVLHDSYSSASAVVMMEVVKLLASLAMCARDGGNTELNYTTRRHRHCCTAT